MSELLLKEKLLTSAVGAEVRIVARVRTITILFQLDARRIGYVFAFLRESGLMSTELDTSIVSLYRSDFSKINVCQANLNRADLREAYLSGANLRGVSLRHTDLYKANLSHADLSETNFSSADFGGADLSAANFINADLIVANLSGAKNVTTEQLSKARSLEGAIMPDGSTHL